MTAMEAIAFEAGKTSSNFAREMRCSTNDAWHFGHVRVRKPEMLTPSTRT